ncbi:hypothetical protein L6452_24229 [Arctium lappa]|uniref:Uncharacterized protein n=1 Tax=Arctium lappa TaxID=4217 RepID=A0ACB9ADE5_ARCLA|nr:hypothetical protein L6452_24229 [Arctium lappa]
MLTPLIFLTGSTAGLQIDPSLSHEIHRRSSNQSLRCSTYYIHNEVQEDLENYTSASTRKTPLKKLFQRFIFFLPLSLLSESKIIENYFGTDTELVKFFNNARKVVAFDIKDFYLKSVFKDINEYCNNRWHVGWAGFKHKYFGRPRVFCFGVGGPCVLGASHSSNVFYQLSVLS